MEIICLDSPLQRLSPSVATIGFFDGVHLGHRYVIDRVLESARHLGLASTVVTFARHPRQVLQSAWQPLLLSTLEEKTSLLSETGIDRLVILPFDVEMARLTARDFMDQVLLRQLSVSVLLTGYDNHFGRRQPGTDEGFHDYVGYGRELGITVLCGDAVDAGGVRVSSSKIRQQLLAGDVRQAARCLGRPYSLSGRVVDGYHIGTSLGFPTANLQPDDLQKLIPEVGAYAVKVCVDGDLQWRPGMMNIGHRPTFDGHRQTLEVHLFDFDDNLYGHQLTVCFIQRLRSELKFDSSEALSEQLAADARQAAEILHSSTL